MYYNDHLKQSICYHLKPKQDEMSLYISEIDLFLEYMGEESRHNFIKNKLGLFDIKKNDKYKYINNDTHLLDLIPSKLAWETPNQLEKNTSSTENNNFYYIHFIAADRIGPQEIYQKSMLPNFPHVGTKGEFAVNLLDKMAQELVNEKLCLGENARTLITQTEEWIGRILNPLSLEVKPLRANYLELLMGGFKPSNVGFGYSCILPIIVTGLIAKPNEKIIIENPEIHLHPKAQSALIDFLIKVSNTGVQVFIESHSDHILNALRVATKEKKIKPEDSSILFFNQNKNKENEITSILIDEKGKLHKKTTEGTMAKIPQGFFDEWTNSMAKLF